MECRVSERAKMEIIRYYDEFIANVHCTKLLKRKVSDNFYCGYQRF